MNAPERSYLHSETKQSLRILATTLSMVLTFKWILHHYEQRTAVHGIRRGQLCSKFSHINRIAWMSFGKIKCKQENLMLESANAWLVSVEWPQGFAAQTPGTRVGRRTLCKNFPDREYVRYTKIRHYCTCWNNLHSSILGLNFLATNHYIPMKTLMHLSQFDTIDQCTH